MNELLLRCYYRADIFLIWHSGIPRVCTSAVWFTYAHAQKSRIRSKMAVTSMRIRCICSLYKRGSVYSWLHITGPAKNKRHKLGQKTLSMRESSAKLTNDSLKWHRFLGQVYFVVSTSTVVMQSWQCVICAKNKWIWGSNLQYYGLCTSRFRRKCWSSTYGAVNYVKSTLIGPQRLKIQEITMAATSGASFVRTWLCGILGGWRHLVSDQCTPRWQVNKMAESIVIQPRSWSTLWDF